MLALAILGVLGLLASGAYNRYIEKTRVYQATVDIGSLQMAIKQYELNNSVLPDDLAAVGMATKLDPGDGPMCTSIWRRSMGTAPPARTTS